MLTYENFTHRGRRWATEKTKYVLVSVSWMEHLGNMPIAEKENFLNKNHPTFQGPSYTPQSTLFLYTPHLTLFWR